MLINTPKEQIFIRGRDTQSQTLSGTLSSWTSSLTHIRVVGAVYAGLIHKVSRVLELSVRLTVFTEILFWIVASFRKSTNLSSSPFLHCLELDLFSVCFAKIWIFLVKVKCGISAPLVSPDKTEHIYTYTYTRLQTFEISKIFSVFYRSLLCSSKFYLFE